MTQLRGTLVLLALVAALGLGLYLSSGEEGVADASEAALGGRSVLEAERLAIRSQLGVQAIELRRVQGYAFELVEPLRDLASAAMLEAIAGTWDTAQLAPAYEPEDITADLLQQTGLDQPRGELRATYSDREIHVEIGDEGPMGHDLYVRKDGTIWFGSKALFTVLAGTVDDYRDPRLFLNAAAGVREIAVTRRGGSERESRLVMRQHEPGRFQLVEPIAARAHLAGAQSFVASLLGMRVGVFEHGTAGPRPDADYEIVVEGAAGVERVRLWRQPNEMLFGIQEPRELVFLIEDHDYSRMFEVSAEQMRSRLLIPKAPDQIAHVVLDPGGGRRAAVLRRGRDGVMELEAPVRRATDPTATARLLRALGSLSVEEFVPDVPEDLAAFGLDEGFFSVSVKGAVDPRPVVVHLGREEGDTCYARRADEPYVAKVAADAARALKTPWVDLVARKVYRYPSINVVELRFAGGGRERRFVQQDGAWREEGGEVPSEHVQSAVETLTHLDARRVLDPDEASDLGPPTTIRIMGLNGAVFQQMNLFEREGGAYLTLPDLDVAFELREADAAVIGRLSP